MFYEDQYKPILDVYKQLRLEGVVFPMRDPKSQHYINFPGWKSPIFDTIEGGKIYEEPNKQMSLRQYRIQQVEASNDIGQDMFRIKKNQQEINDQIYIKEFMQTCQEFIQSFDQQKDSDYGSIDLLIQQVWIFIEDLQNQNINNLNDYEKKEIIFKQKNLLEIKYKLEKIKQEIDLKKRSQNDMDFFEFETKQEKVENTDNDLLMLDIDNQNTEIFKQNNNYQQEEELNNFFKQQDTTQYKQNYQEEKEADPFEFVDQKFREIF